MGTHKIKLCATGGFAEWALHGINMPFEFNPDLIQFIKNVVFPSKVKDIVEEEGVITITPPDSETRGYLIGKSASNLRNTEEVVKRYFELEEIKVI